MNNPPGSHSMERMLDLLALQATEGLTDLETAELQALLLVHSDMDPLSFDHAAAAMDLAMTGAVEPMPVSLREKLDQQVFTSMPGPRDRMPFTLSPDSALPASLKHPTTALTWLGWGVAVSLATVLLWLNWPSGNPKNIVAERDQLRNDPAARAMTFKGSAGTSVRGNVLWSPTQQAGFIEVEGLAPTDSESQYQLWIVDSDRPGSAPIDGGLFDINDSGVAVLKVNAKLPVFSAAAFAITREKRGGVVVSQSEKLLLLLPG